MRDVKQIEVTIVLTKMIDPKYIDQGINKFYFIDTPGLNEEGVDEENKELLRKEVSGNIEEISRIRCILIIMKEADYRFLFKIPSESALKTRLIGFEKSCSIIGSLKRLNSVLYS